MVIYDISFQSPVENLAFDDVLLHHAEKDQDAPDVLRLWESPVPFVVLGRIGKLNDDINIDACRRDNIGILRRRSGGGTVAQGPGCLNFALILSKKRNPALADLHRSYQEILGHVIALLTSLGILAEFQPVSDLALTKNHKKFSGNAQRRSRNFILHHGTILYNFDLRLIERYLKMPLDVPAYRAARTHSEFVTNISSDRESLSQAFFQRFHHGIVIKKISSYERALLAQSVEDGQNGYNIIL